MQLTRLLENFVFSAKPVAKYYSAVYLYAKNHKFLTICVLNVSTVGVFLRNWIIEIPKPNIKEFSYC